MSGSMRTSLELLVVSIALAGACADDVARCGSEVCHGPAGVPCRCAPSTATTGPSKGVGVAGGPATSAAGSDAAPAGVVLDGTAQGSTIDLVVGQQVALTLATIGPGNYGDPELSSSAVAFDGSKSPQAQNPGGPTQIYVFHAVAVGSTTVTIPHSQAGHASFTLTFHVS